MGDLEEEVWDGRCIPYRLVLITLSVDKSTSRSVAWSVSGSGGQQEHIHERGETKKKEWSPSASLPFTQMSNRLLSRVPFECLSAVVKVKIRELVAVWV